MKILFSAVPSPAHLLPLMPLARAARSAGHETAFLTVDALHPLLDGVDALPAGADAAQMFAEFVRTRGFTDPLPEAARALTEEVVAEAARARHGADAEPEPGAGSANADLFARARLDLSADVAVTSAGGFGPQLVVADEADQVGPLVAAVLGVPWVKHRVIAEGLLGGAIARAMVRAAEPHHRRRGVAPTSPVAVLDPVPGALHLPGRAVPDGELAVRPGQGVEPAPTRAPGRARRVLVTLGTSIDDEGLIGAVVDAALATGAQVVATTCAAGDVAAFEAAHPGARAVGFVPLATLLDDADAVVGTGGMGTVSAALARGLPLVVLPLLADQPVTAERLVEVGAGVRVSAPHEVTAALATVLADGSFASRARGIAEEIAAMPTAEEVLPVLLERVSTPTAARAT